MNDMEEQPLESLPGSSNVELIIEPRAATALCTSDQWIFLAKGTALEVYDASELMDLVPLSPSKGVFHFPFIVELLVSLRDGFSGTSDDDFYIIFWRLKFAMFLCVLIYN